MTFAGSMITCFLVFDAVGDEGLGGLQPNYYHLASFLSIAGTGCTLLAYHALKSGEEDTAVKKKIFLACIVTVTSVVAVYTLDVLYRLGIL